LTPPTISIIGSALTGNMGAVAMLESTIASLRELLPGVRFVLFSVYPDQDRRANPHADLEIVSAAPRQLGITINLLGVAYRCLPFLRGVLRRRSRAIGALARSSALLDQGGITFSDGREKYLLYNVASILPALMVGIPVVKCAQAVGPFEGRLNRLVARFFLPRMHRIHTRGRITHELAEAFGLTNLERSADLAFALEFTGLERDSVGQSLDMMPFSRGDVVGVSPSAVIARKVDSIPGGDYVRETVAFIRGLLDEGRTVAIIPHSVRRHTERTHNNDLPLCRDLATAIGPDERLILVDQELSSQELRYVISLCGFFVASRFHAMVSALATGVPTVVIGWSHKYREVLEMFDLKKWALGHEIYASQLLAERLAVLESESDEVRALLRVHLPTVKTLARKQLVDVATLSLSKSS
jgi:colanic acid/amylovoran biosynthesis protein